MVGHLNPLERLGSGRSPTAGKETVKVALELGEQRLLDLVRAFGIAQSNWSELVPLARRGEIGSEVSLKVGASRELLRELLGREPTASEISYVSGVKGGF
jgi:hypothetical protein